MRPYILLKYGACIGFAANLLTATSTRAQAPDAVSERDTTIHVSSQYSSEITDLKDLLGLENIEYQKIRFSSPELVGKTYALRVLEIWDGEVRDSTVLTGSSKPKPLTDTIFELRVISKINDQKNISMHVHMPSATARRVFKTIPEQAGMYSLRNVVKESKAPVVLNQTFYLMAYILPIAMPDKPGWLSYCNVDDSGEDVREWGKKLGIPHYIVFEMVFF